MSEDNQSKAKPGDIDKLEKRFLNQKWYPEELAPGNPTCPNIACWMLQIIQVLEETLVPLNYLWRDGGLFRVAMPQINKHRKRLGQTSAKAVSAFIDDHFKKRSGHGSQRSRPSHQPQWERASPGVQNSAITIKERQGAEPRAGAEQPS
ncbi:hypothetical protein NM208_g2458 [Fusarium decemcellulare]|uniref:Uncharacterized protein n=1 Tax=Fusarium decemcellulare TaxID=57161 RepID=A0ACC1SSN0_9HYPO|nr:hypothetical protein NM208_g2458 [Fusarium decemcellulare]